MNTDDYRWLLMSDQQCLEAMELECHWAQPDYCGKKALDNKTFSERREEKDAKVQS